MNGGTFLYPNISSLPSQNSIPASDRTSRRQEGMQGEFNQVFDQALERASVATEARELDQIRPGLKFSAHASQRLRDRKIDLDPVTLGKVNEAIDRAEAKGVEETLVLTSQAALIVSVKNRTVITALDRGSMSGNVFTNIDGAVVI